MSLSTCKSGSTSYNGLFSDSFSSRGLKEYSNSIKAAIDAGRLLSGGQNSESLLKNSCSSLSLLKGNKLSEQSMRNHLFLSRSTNIESYCPTRGIHFRCVGLLQLKQIICLQKLATLRLHCTHLEPINICKKCW